jgi:tRNA(Ile)-lysidine synthase
LPIAKRSSPEQKVLAYIKENNLLGRGEKVVVAVSGGPDSVCLLSILYALREELGIELHIAHLDHQLRGADSKADAKYVSALAKKLKIPATIEARDVRAYRAKHRLTLEEAARDVRYDFLAETAVKTGAGKIAAGHTANDQAETILMHIIRGSGIKGLRGLLPISHRTSPSGPITIIRPLLALTRQETEEYCLALKLGPRSDASNLSLKPLRNRVRRRLLPELRKYNPQIDAALLRLAENAADDLGFIEMEAAKAQAKIVRKEKGAITIVKKGFLALPNALKRQILRSAIEELLGSLKDIETGHVESLMAALKKPAGKSIGLPFGVDFKVEYDRYILSVNGEGLCPYSPLDGETDLAVPGETDFSGWRVTAAFCPPEALPHKYPEDAFTACFDAGKTGEALIVRGHRPGDCFQPLGMGQPKKLNVFMIDARLPRDWRENIPIVCAGEEIIWLAGCRMDERYKVTPATNKVLKLEFRRA